MDHLNGRSSWEACSWFVLLMMSSSHAIVPTCFKVAARKNLLSNISADLSRIV